MAPRSLHLLSLAVVACKSKDTTRAIDGKVQIVVASIEKRLGTTAPEGMPTGAMREFIVRLRRGNAEDCMYLAHIDGARTVVRDAKLLGQYKRLCEHDMYLSSLRMLAEVAEAARKAQPTVETLPECDATDVFIASDELKKNKTADAESAALEARFTAACAPPPPTGSAARAAAGSGSGTGSASTP